MSKVLTVGLRFLTTLLLLSSSVTGWSSESCPASLAAGVIKINQCGAETYKPDLCNYDAAEIAKHMIERPEQYDRSKIKVLCITNSVVAGTPWRVHFVAYDGRGNIFDPAFVRSQEVRPIPIQQYLAAVSDQHPSTIRTQFRIIDPQIYLSEQYDPFWTLLYFSYGMRGLEDRAEGVRRDSHHSMRADRGLPMGIDALNALAPAVFSDELVDALSGALPTTLP